MPNSWNLRQGNIMIVVTKLTALSCGDQSLTFAAFAGMMRALRPFAEAAGRTIPAEPSMKIAGAVAA